MRKHCSDLTWFTGFASVVQVVQTSQLLARGSAAENARQYRQIADRTPGLLD